MAILKNNFITGASSVLRYKKRKSRPSLVPKKNVYLTRSGKGRVTLTTESTKNGKVSVRSVKTNYMTGNGPRTLIKTTRTIVVKK